MSKTTLLSGVLVLATAACTVNNTTNNPPGVTPPTGAPRQAKGKLPMSGPMKPKKVTAVKEMGGKPVVAARSDVSAAGAFDFSLEVGVRYMFIVTLLDDTMISLGATDASSSYEAWVAIGNPLTADVSLDFGSVTIVNNNYVSNTVLLYIDWDADGISDFADTDDDNDGISDADDDDIDNDGHDDETLDADGDGTCDLVDDDDDGDGIADVDDDDDDGDGVPDDQETDSVDIDGDGQPDDGDGVPDDCAPDECP
jgi:hypothetical protein